MGQELAVNYMNQYYYYNEKKELKEEQIIEIIQKIGEIFHYKSAIIFHTYENFSCFKSNYSENKEIFLYMNLFNRTLYNYIKYNKKPFKSIKNKSCSYKSNFKKIDSLINKSIPKDLIEVFHINFNGKTLKELLIYTIEKNFIEYVKITGYLKINELCFGILNMPRNRSELKIFNSNKENEIYNLIYRRDFNKIIS
jgi:hypothetical protein